MAAVDIEAIGRSAAQSAQRMTGPQKATLALAFVATAVGMFVMSRVTSSTPMGTLYGDLEPEAAAAVVDQLESQGVPYELLYGGRTVQVPADQVHALRLDMSAQGLPNSAGGWSVLEDQGLTTSAFDQRVGYQRAMQGELARTIAAIDGVSQANVHLVIPEHDFLADDNVEASASVLVSTGGEALAPMQVDAIVNLVASSVEGLTADQVSVADESGRVLAAPGDGSGVMGIEGDTQLRAKRAYEAHLESDIESMLAAVVGPGLAIVAVEADLDFDSVTTVTEQYQPARTEDGQQMLIEETTRAEQYSDPDAEADTGSPLEVEVPEEETGQTTDGEDLGANDGLGTGGGLDYSLDERDARFAVDKVVTNAEQAAGDLTSLSVAVLLDETAIDAARVGEIESLVVAAAGIDAERGDTLAVTLMPLNEDFRATAEANATETEGSASGGFDIVGLIRMVFASLIALLVVVLSLRYLARASKEAAEPEVTPIELDSGPSQAALPQGENADEDEDLEPADVRLESLIANQTDDVAGVLRSWLNEAEEVPR